MMSEQAVPTTTNTTGAALHGVIRHRIATSERLYGVVDAARDRALAVAAPGRVGREVDCLFSPNVARHMYPVAPYQIRIEYRGRYPYPGSAYLDTWAAHLGGSAGILLLTRAQPQELCAHLRQMFQVADEQGHRYFFRFYDPRVLRAYLPTCTRAEAQEFFGPVRRILVEGEEAGSMLVAGVYRDGVRVNKVPLG